MTCKVEQENEELREIIKTLREEIREDKEKIPELLIRKKNEDMESN